MAFPDSSLKNGKYLERNLTNPIYSNKSWNDHVMKEHNVYAYLYFIIYVRTKPDNDCTGIEKYVKDKVKGGDITFFPINKCLSL